MPVAILLHVPQQPIFDGKREDEIIAYTFREFLKTGDADLAAACCRWSRAPCGRWTPRRRR